MKESYRENLASSSGLELYAGDGDIVGVASVRRDAGQPLSSEILTFACRPCTDRGKATSDAPKMARRVWTRRSRRHLTHRSEQDTLRLVESLCEGLPR
jgi:hypothetical protein